MSIWRIFAHMLLTLRWQARVLCTSFKLRICCLSADLVYPDETASRAERIVCGSSTEGGRKRRRECMRRNIETTKKKRRNSYFYCAERLVSKTGGALRSVPFPSQLSMRLRALTVVFAQFRVFKLLCVFPKASSFAFITVRKISECSGGMWAFTMLQCRWKLLSTAYYTTDLVPHRGRA